MPTGYYTYLQEHNPQRETCQHGEHLPSCLPHCCAGSLGYVPAPWSLGGNSFPALWRQQIPEWICNTHCSNVTNLLQNNVEQSSEKETQD